MFKKWTREKISDLREDLSFKMDKDSCKSELENKIDKRIYVECETCGCLVKKEKAIKVQEMVDKTASFSFAYLGHEPYKLIIPDEKEIKTTYYCLHCNPNKNEKITKTKTKRKMRKNGNRK